MSRLSANMTFTRHVQQSVYMFRYRRDGCFQIPITIPIGIWCLQVLYSCVQLIIWCLCVRIHHHHCAAI